MIKKIVFIFFVLLSAVADAQNTNGPEMADAMRADGKIYVVIGVICIVFAAIISLLVIIERQLKKLESKSGSNPSK